MKYMYQIDLSNYYAFEFVLESCSKVTKSPLYVCSKFSMYSNFLYSCFDRHLFILLL